ncbi:hypothetical protein VTO42DRAFT_8685 [Malbranchea cinnamomea]
MSNDVSRISADMNPDHEPYCIGYPVWAGVTTYSSVVRRNPRMKQQVARACIVGGYKFLERKLADGHEEQSVDSNYENWKMLTIKDIITSSEAGFLTEDGGGSTS